MAEKETKKSQKSSQKSNFVPFEKEYVLRPLKLFFIIVPAGQANAIVSRLNEFDIACSFIFYGEGNAKYSMVSKEKGVSDYKKQIVMAAIREDKVEFIKRKLEERFAVSRASRGFAFSINITSVAGVSIYKFLTNTRKVTKVSKHGRK